jgi:hypothetical protein
VFAERFRHRSGMSGGCDYVVAKFQSETRDPQSKTPRRASDEPGFHGECSFSAMLVWL